MQSENTFQRPGYTTVSPYLMVDDVAVQLEFIKNVFQVKPTEDIGQNPDGHTEIKLGDTTIMIGQGRPQWPSRQSMNYIYVENVDQIYERAKEFGANLLLEPTERYYGDRECGFEDSQGNQWWCGTFQQILSTVEMRQRFEENKR
ncbi:VOC family protein [Dyadobacter tibetensis]|uniref:VOC family protein n=1 Tax=Dyadobacter tibetensis TaxID=1211851 RepID=UPI00046FCE4D|nr:VOC family protein [Dyadobacter tibetensis]